ncbi:MAG: phosphopyruvate hydratase [bacterium]
MSKIKNIQAREILDSRGNPTLEVSVILYDGVVGTAKVPSGASTGSHEAWELRDGGKRYNGKGVLKAVANVNGPIRRLLVGKKPTTQKEIDYAMVGLDGTKNKKKLGANAILGVSMAVVAAAAQEKKLPLYRYLADLGKYPYPSRLPYPMMNVINGGVHASSGLDIQEYMVVPKQQKFSERIRAGVEVFWKLKKVLAEQGFSTSVGDEGGFAPALGDNERPLALLADVVVKAGYKKEVVLAMDMAASEFYNGKTYLFGGKKLSAKKLMDWQKEMVGKYPLLSIEDGLAEDDWTHWQTLTKELGKKIMLVGDDLFATNPARLKKGIASKVGNAILIKLNQIGTVTETLATIKLAQRYGYKIIVSHRSGETADTFISDLAVAVGAEYIKAGSLSRSERVEKYNRLLQIASELKR